MSFDAILNEILEASRGCYGVALMGIDGIPIAQATADRVEVAEHDDVDLEEVVSVMGVEFGRVLEETRKATDSVEGGSLEELYVRMGRYQVAIRGVDAETYLVMVLDEAGNAGKGRFLMRRQLSALRDEL